MSTNGIDYVDMFAAVQRENTKLREQLAEKDRHILAIQESVYNDQQGTDAQIAALVERAEAAEAKLKALEEQEPVAYLNLAVWAHSGYTNVYATPERAFSNQDALYIDPVPPADVQELQRELSAMQTLYEEQVRRRAELERKLTEQQTKMRMLRMLICRVDAVSSEGKEAKTDLCRILSPLDTDEELNTLLAQAEEKGRKEAVPDDMVDAVSKAMRRAWQLGQTYWQQADSQSISQQRRSDATQESFNRLVDETRAMLSAPTPKEKP